ncbi:MAG: dihydrolipoyl dehydrogenase [Proteobacteria bacterium]|nr:dihydrolipoyl dehydrogenase [Pseudomonadota bacterium]
MELPDIGDFDSVEIIEVLIAPGDHIEIESPLITLESDKATMDIPSPVTGQISELLVSIGEKVSQGDVVATVSIQVDPATDLEASLHDPSVPTDTVDSLPPSDSEEQDVNEADTTPRFDVAVLGSGPGGYTAAFRAADLGLSVALIERYPNLGGVCLNVGCIPSKALLHAARVIEETREMAPNGISFGEPKIDIRKLCDWKKGVVTQLTEGLAALAKKRNVTIFSGTGAFRSDHEIVVTNDTNELILQFEKAIISTGSEPIRLPGIPSDPRILDSTAALSLQSIPERLLVIGGGIIGLEMATVYRALGSAVSIVEMAPQLMPGTDPDLVRPLAKRLKSQCNDIFLNTRVSRVDAGSAELVAHFEGDRVPASAAFDAILVAVGRTPNGRNVGAENAGVHPNAQGFISVDHQQRTNQPHIFAIGDVVGQPMLAHKATHEGKVAAEVAAGQKSAFDARIIPSVAYTDPEVAWVGLTESQAKAQNIAYEKGIFPWAASGRALALARSEGFTKLLFDPQSNRILGGGIVGTTAGDLIAEIGLAIEMNCVAQDIGLTIHPHPTLSETVGLAAETFEGTITDLYAPKKR